MTARILVSCCFLLVTSLLNNVFQYKKNAELNGKLSAEVTNNTEAKAEAEKQEHRIIKLQTDIAFLKEASEKREAVLKKELGSNYARLDADMHTRMFGGGPVGMVIDVANIKPGNVVSIPGSDVWTGPMNRNVMILNSSERAITVQYSLHGRKFEDRIFQPEDGRPFTVHEEGMQIRLAPAKK